LSGPIENEVEPAGEAVPRLCHPERQLRTKKAIFTVARLVGEIELSRKHLPAGRLHLHMDMRRAPRVARGYDRAQSIATLRVSELVPALAEALVVVNASRIGLPEIDERARHRLAGAREHDPGNLDHLAFGVR